MSSLDFSRNQQLALLAMVGLSLLGLAYGQMRGGRVAAVTGSAISITDPSKGSTVDIVAPSTLGRTRGTTGASIVVHVGGCVKKRGVYTLPAGSRVVDAVHAAGGPTRSADTDGINLATKLKDCDRIIVPAKASPRASPPASGAAPAGIGGRTGQATVNINAAGLEELDRLPGVGPVTAQKIVDYRDQIGRFTSVEQLEEIKGIGPKKLENMRPFVRL